ncbi:MAG: hypothetical protein HKN25_07065 [Pyrinomonadaceae bacterium]|nr:hypothetical protein [Pyrinomonadaceae bacterium]
MKKYLISFVILFSLAIPFLAQTETNTSQTESKTKIDSDTKTDSAAEGISPCFKSDKCTLFPDGNYADCCVAHDKDYFKGGTGKERAASDKRLYRCVKKKKGWQNKLLAPMMWLGVRVFGTAHLPTPFRWGFGKSKKFQKCMKKLEEMKNAKPAETKEI